MPAAYPYPQSMQPGQFPPLPLPPQPPRTRRRPPRWVLIGAPILVLAIVAAVVVVVTRSGQPDPSVSKVQCNTHELTSCLVAPPSAAQHNSGAWDTSTTVDTAAYAAAYPDAAALHQPSELSTLINAAGLTSIAHRDWTLSGNQVDLILLQFGSAQGAKSWAEDRTGDFLSLDDGPQLAVTGITDAKAYTTSTPDSSGNISARFVDTVGDIALEVHYASQGSMQDHDFDLWTSTEYASLQTTPPPAPVPTPTATAFEAATCPGALSSCLMPLPAGGAPVPGIPETYTIDSYTADQITQSAAADVKQRMHVDNVISIATENWGLSGFNQDAQLTLIQTRTDSQAQDLTTYIGNNASYTQDFSIPGYGSAVARYSSTPDAQGFQEGLVTAQVGTVFMSLWATFTNSFNTSSVSGWATEELNLLTHDTQPHWGFPIPRVTTPALPPFSPGTCSGAAASACVMAVPSGATVKQAAGGGSVTDLALGDFVSDLYTDRQDYEQTWLTSDGLKDAASEGWTASDGANAIDYVVQFASSRQAQAAALQQAGDSMPGTQSCSVSSLPNLVCLVLPEYTDTGEVPIRITAWSGKYEIDLEVNQTDSADTGDALNWAQTQLQLLAGS